MVVACNPELHRSATNDAVIRSIPMLRRLLESYVEHHDKKLVRKALADADAWEKRIFLASAEMAEWQTDKPALTPDELVRKARVWLVRKYDLDPRNARLEACLAFCEFASEHTDLRRVWPQIEQEAAAFAALTFEAAGRWEIALSNMTGYAFERCRAIVNLERAKNGLPFDQSTLNWPFHPVPMSRTAQKPRVVRSRADPSRRKIVCGWCGHKFAFGRSACPTCDSQYVYRAGKPILESHPDE